MLRNSRHLLAKWILSSASHPNLPQHVPPRKAKKGSEWVLSTQAFRIVAQILTSDSRFLEI